MLTKNAKNRADWNELFSYDFVDGKLQQRKPNSEPLKESLATITTDSESLKTPAKVRSPIKMKQLVSPGKAK
jgi:Trp operon repressor